MNVGDLIKRKALWDRRYHWTGVPSTGVVLESCTREGTGLDSFVVVLTNDGNGRPHRRQWRVQDAVLINECR